MLVCHAKSHDKDSIKPSASFSCKRCQLEYKTEEDIKVHAGICGQTQSISNKDSIIPPSIPIKSPHRRKQAVGVGVQNRLFPCSEIGCQQLFEDEFSIVKHKILKHPTDKPFKCEICEDFVSDSIESLLSHIGIHEEEIHKPFLCDQCHKSFRLECHLAIHMRAHMQRESRSVQIREKALLMNPDKLMQLVKKSYRNKKVSNGSAAEVFCETCDDVFPCQAALDEHTLATHSQLTTEDSHEMEIDSRVEVQATAREDSPTEASSGDTLRIEREMTTLTSLYFSHLECEPLKTPAQPPRPHSLHARTERSVRDVQQDFTMLYSKIQDKSVENNNNDSIESRRDQEKSQNVELSIKTVKAKEDESVLCKTLSSTVSASRSKTEEARASEDEEGLSDHVITSIVKNMKLQIGNERDSTPTKDFPPTADMGVEELEEVSDLMDSDNKEYDEDPTTMDSDGEVELTYKRFKLNHDFSTDSIGKKRKKPTTITLEKPVTRSSPRNLRGVSSSIHLNTTNSKTLEKKKPEHVSLRPKRQLAKGKNV
jgi:hypothetical protein